MSTRSKAISGIIWTFTDSLLLKGLSLIAVFILGRLLTKEDFGINGIMVVFINLGVTIVDSGLGNSLIRSKDTDDLDFSSVFWTNIVLGLVFYFLLFFSFPYIVRFFDQPIPISILRLSSLGIVISSFSTVQLAILTANMQFKKIMFTNMPGAILGPIIGILMAYHGFGILSLVAMTLITPLMQTISLWIVSPWRPLFTIDFGRTKKHFHFGYKLLLSSLLDTVFKNIYNIIIGKRYLLSELGVYDRAQKINELPTSVLTTIVSKVTYPLLANIQDNKEETANAYKQILRMSLYISAPIMLGLSALAQPLITFLLGNNWIEVVPYFQILCLASMLYPIHSINLNVLKVYGKTDLFLRLEVIKKILTAICILISWPFGILGLMWSVVATSVLSLLVNTYFSKALINYSTKHQLLDMIPTLLAATSMYFFMYIAKQFIVGLPLILQILVNFTVGVIFYFGISYLFKLTPFQFLIKIIKSYRS
ncbi:lipopolysaccharide biosynthesis protein [Sphingobacterium sp.]|uniref:lipopolysaccharide biosynthesis protein n=1 Tax=Sphingobacterium sp. TaxID=341027 RepID=UPI00289E6CB9|nr:lipopolysaccharide biosynthesis protein [Sphingobacterium sp.]